MLTRIQLDLLWNIEVACERCIRAAKYFGIASGAKDNLWVFTQNCYGGICVIHWCQVFGSCSEPIHYSNLFAKGTTAGISRDQVTKRLRDVVGMSEAQYFKLWQEVKDARDKFLVHNEFKATDSPVFPDLDLLTKICLEMREIIHQIITSEKSVDPKLQGDIEHFVSHYTNNRFLSELDRELPRLACAISGKKN